MDSGKLASEQNLKIKRQKYSLAGSEEHNLLLQPPLNDPNKKDIIDRILAAGKDKSGSTMIILNEIQSQIGYVSQPIQEYVALKLNLSASTIHGVVTFYSFFTTAARGNHTIKFCMGTACYVGGTPQLIEKARQIYGTEVGQTTADGNVTLEICRCVGSCSQAPVLVIDEQLYGRVRPSKVAQLFNKTIKPVESSK
jgi:NADH:ubiquinone oxidoreductase subunit E